jgi:FkbM family methyltransferase
MKVSDLLWVAVGFAIALPLPYISDYVQSPSWGGGGGAGAGGGARAAAGGGGGGAVGASAGSGGGGRARPPLTRYLLTADTPSFCNKSAPFPPDGDYPDWDVMPASGPTAWPAVDCHWAPMWHPGVPMRPLNVCTHDPAVDGVISTFLHTYHFWGGPDDYNLLLAMGPCTAARPFMLDIGANLGVYTILGASRGCRAVAFEPLSQNILRLRESLAAMGASGRTLLYKHAVGKSFGSVKIGFRPSNPGASAIGIDADVTEKMAQVTVDGLLLGPSPPVFPDSPPGLPRLSGATINFIKIDTEGYDVAVVAGMLRTLVEGRPPHILIEFGPNDAAGTAGCNPYHFVQFMYGAGYRMYEGARPYPLRSLLADELPYALSGKGRRVFEAWFIHDDAAAEWVNLGMLQPVEMAADGARGRRRSPRAD